MIKTITNKEIAKYLDVCDEYIPKIRNTGKLSKIRKKLLIKFYEEKIEEIKKTIDNILL